MTVMALGHKKATTIALEPEMDRLLTRAAKANGVSRAEFIRQRLAVVLEAYKPHPRPTCAGIITDGFPERGDDVYRPHDAGEIPRVAEKRERYGARPRGRRR